MTKREAMRHVKRVIRGYEMGESNDTLAWILQSNANGKPPQKRRPRDIGPVGEAIEFVMRAGAR